MLEKYIFLPRFFGFKRKVLHFSDICFINIAQYRFTGRTLSWLSLNLNYVMFFLSKNSVVLFSILYYTTRANKSLKQFFSSSFLGLRPPQVQPARGATTPRCTCRSPPASQTASETSSSPTTNRTGHRLGTAIDSATTAPPPPSRNRTTTIAPAAP